MFPFLITLIFFFFKILNAEEETYTPKIITKGKKRRVPNTLQIGVTKEVPPCEHPLKRYDEVEV